MTTNNGWISVEDQWPPDPCPRILVTNNIGARNAHGHMSHVWCVTGLHNGEPSLRDRERQIFALEDDYSIVHRVTHWRIAVPEIDSQNPDETEVMMNANSVLIENVAHNRTRLTFPSGKSATFSKFQTEHTPSGWDSCVLFTTAYGEDLAQLTAAYEELEGINNS